MAGWSELDAFLQKHSYTYINDWGVMFSRVAQGFMLVDCQWPGYEGPHYIMLTFLCNDADAFYEKLQIENVSMLDQVNPEVLFRLFYEGEAYIVCSTDDDDSLQFEICNNLLVASTGDTDIMHEVREELKSPEDFIQHTIDYFKFVNQEQFNPN